ncbi:IS982 family transposase [Candidatus Parcubacteria bacterium]|nr:IS982 family transposase [Candidatus Parcubacteria bacterium]
MNTLVVFRQIKEKVKAYIKQLKLKIEEKTTGRPKKLSTIQTLTLVLYKHTQGIPTKKAVWKDFGLKCSYKTFVVNVNKLLVVATKLLLMLMKENRKHSHLIKYTDSTDIAVCLNKNAKYHKTMKGIAQWGRSSKGYYYGLKLHLSADYEGRVLSICFTPANTDDRTPFMKLNKDLYGLFVADAGYISEKLRKEFHIENKRMLIAKPKANMKKLETPLQHILYSSRSLVESHFNNLKKFHNIVNTLPRSIDGYLCNYICSLLAHVIS